MYEYDINMIPYDESKQIFEEIMVEFYSQKYRSCICNLNSLLYLDLIKKLEDLKNNMSDPKAKEILDELNQMNVNDELYSSCEKKLLDSCREKGYITKYFYEEALNLRKIRNRCAHPAFCGEPLFTPDKLETAMYIKKVFNELLIINNINYYNITNFVLDDIKDAYERGISVSNKSLKNRVKRLFSKCDEKNMQRLFNTLFDLSIIKNDDDCKKYRDYTYMYMKILIEIANSKNYIIVKENIKKMNIKNLDNQLFSKNNYISKMVSDGIITLADVEKYNPEIIELYKEYLINSEEINDIYIQIFGSFEKYVEFSIGEEVGWYNSKKILETFDIAHGKKYFYELLKKVIESTPNVNGFDIGDFCLKEYCDNFNLLSDNESRELLLIMNRHSQIINSKKNHDEEFKNKILDLFKTTDYDYLIRAIENGEEILPF